MNSKEKEKIFQAIALLENIQHVCNKLWEDEFSYPHENYKRKYISAFWGSDSDETNEFFVMISDYIAFLGRKLPEIETQCMLDNLCPRSRIKQQFSVLAKLQKYILSPEKGDVPVAKCINDLFGARIIVGNETDYLAILEELNEALSQDTHARVVKSFHGSYSAIHIYVQEYNYVFPWELQIWREEDKESNERSHLQYKERYLLDGTSY